MDTYFDDMAKDAGHAKDFWGYCIQPNKDATPVFEQLLLGIHGYIVKHVNPWNEPYLSPAKLAQFYQLVGGDFNRLFLDSPPASLSFVYSSLGCQHNLHQTENLFAPPSIPALTAQGFVRWQVIQLLLSPAEHVPYIQRAVSTFELVNDGPGGPFPKTLPTECLPQTPDVEMTKWHNDVEQRLRDQCTPQSRRASQSHPLRVVVEPGVSGPASPRRRPHLYQSPQSPSSRRQSASSGKESERERVPSTPHPLRNTSRYERPSVVSGSSASSSSSESPPPRAAPQPRPHHGRSPRSYSAARSPQPRLGPPPRDTMSRRHSSHGIYEQATPAKPAIRESLSPQFYAGPPRSGNGPSPSNMRPPPPPNKANSVPVPQPRRHRHTVSHDRNNHSWRDKLSAYVGLTHDQGTAHDRGDRADPRDIGKDRYDGREQNRRPPPESVRFVEGIGGVPVGRRRVSSVGDDSDSTQEMRRRPARHTRRHSAEESE